MNEITFHNKNFLRAKRSLSQSINKENNVRKCKSSSKKALKQLRNYFSSTNFQQSPVKTKILQRSLNSSTKQE